MAKTNKPTDYGILTEPPEPPDYLSEGARACWPRIAGAAVALGTLAGCDERALALCCEALSQEAVLRDVLNREGYTIQSGTGEGSKAHPACRLLAETRTQSAALLAAYGLTPKSRQMMRKLAPGELPAWQMKRS